MSSRVQDAFDGSGMDEKSEDPSLPESVSKAPNRGRYVPESNSLVHNFTFRRSVVSVHQALSMVSYSKSKAAGACCEVVL